MINAIGNFILNKLLINFVHIVWHSNIVHNYLMTYGVSKSYRFCFSPYIYTDALVSCLIKWNSKNIFYHSNNYLDKTSHSLYILWVISEKFSNVPLCQTPPSCLLLFCTHSNKWTIILINAIKTDIWMRNERELDRK